MTVVTVEDRISLWRKYLHLQVFNQLCRVWVKLMSPPTTFSLTSSIIIWFYVTIRNEGVPVTLTLIFFCVGISIFAIFFWLLYEVIMVKRAADRILATLTSTEDGNYKDFSPQQKRYINKRGKATRAIGYRIGDFMEISLDVPLGIWDEILNQLLFLLSL